MLKKTLYFILACLLTVFIVFGCGRSEKVPETVSVSPDPFALNARLGRGINLGNYLEAPKAQSWGVEIVPEDYPRIRDAGFSCVRMPVRWSDWADSTAPYAIESDFFETVDRNVKAALDNGLIVILNMHHYLEMFQEPMAHKERFIAMWRQIAEHYRDFPPELLLEPLNEPNKALDAASWNGIIQAVLPVIRESNPDRTLVIGPSQWNQIAKLDSLAIPGEERNVIVTFHYYSPHHFTHQGASWSGPLSQSWLGTTWGSDEDKAAVIADFDTALAWSKKHNRPLLLGEFGAYSKADMDSRVRWTAFVSAEAVKRGFSFTYWEYCAGFGAYDRETASWREPLLNALIPQK